jgi:hypothetical protein
MEPSSKKVKVSVEEINQQVTRGLPRDVQIEILRRLDARSLTNYCLTSLYGRQLCQDENLWRRWIETQYPLLLRFKNPAKSYKNFALAMIYAIGKLQEYFQVPYIPSPNFNPILIWSYGQGFSTKEMLKLVFPYAVETSNSNLVESLINKGITKLSSGYQIAAKNNDTQMINTLDKLRERFNLKPAHNDELDYILNGAIEGNHFSLIENTVNAMKIHYFPEQISQVLGSEIIHAASKRNEKIAKYLFEEGGRISDNDLYRLEVSEDTELPNYLIQIGVLDQNRLDEIGFMPDFLD